MMPKDVSTTTTLCERVILNLSEILKQTKCLLAFDNFFTTCDLMNALFEDGIYACGTVRSNRRNLPGMLKRKDKVKRGEFQFATRGVVSATKWQDSKPVTMLSTAHSPADTSMVYRTNKDGTKTQVGCPKVVEIYNSIMGGVDHFDQLVERYCISRRSRKWWHRIFYWLIDLAVVNSYIAWKIHSSHTVGSSKKDQLSFRIRLARQLINGFSTRKRRGRPVAFKAKKRGVRAVPDEVRTVQVGKSSAKTTDELETLSRM